jgi:hypothetical protein
MNARSLASTFLPLGISAATCLKQPVEVHARGPLAQLLAVDQRRILDHDRILLDRLHRHLLRLGCLLTILSGIVRGRPDPALPRGQERELPPAQRAAAGARRSRRLRLTDPDSEGASLARALRESRQRVGAPVAQPLPEAFLFSCDPRWDPMGVKSLLTLWLRVTIP